MEHHHHHSHSHSHASNKRALLIGFLITSAFMLVEAVGGFLTNSLALLSDAGHMLSDAVSLGIGVLAFALSEKVADYSRTYGYKRIEILAAVFNGVTLLFISGFIFVEAIQRFSEPEAVSSLGMLTIATIGLIVNIVVAWILHKGDTEGNLNLRAAFLHVIGDMLGSVGAIIAGLLIMFFDWNWADPLASIIVGILVLISGWRVTRDSLHVLMEGTPKDIKLENVIETIKKVPGIRSIHDLHVWTITSGHNALSCHAVVDGNISIRESQEILRDLEHQLLHQNIHHVTIQLENDDHPHDDSVLCQAKVEAGHHGHHHH